MADIDVLKKVPVREQDPKVRATNFEEVCLGYNKEEAMNEASRCLNCKKAKCVEGCPVSINIPAFVHEVKEGNFEKAYQIIRLLNDELAAEGYIKIAGKCPRKYFEKRYYGYDSEG